ncbi:hypothetical protein [Paracidovorax cattleyae]|uniref:Uncharacterized protein n=1 Tax=Paracidovorax cattleyae TaxID=80868 RepID=A0A1H0WNC5_9BURK|nr:hypothetical protein [Paracidovorax cattleyae]MBF9266271.1 hypothetical protein [Paracidovorax cattleyae]SDP92230.1 hypothetical protein SAMN04489708_1454 [Paracidovorax cattleyae]
MKKSLFLIAALSLCSFAIAKGGGGHGGGHSGSHHSAGSSGSHGSSHPVSGYTRKDGTHVAPSHATNPNGTRLDNWSTKGNVNPHTGKEGTKEP